MRAERLLGRLESGEMAFGAVIHLADPAAVEIAAIAGFDWVSIPVEHAMLDLQDLTTIQLAADARGVTTLLHIADPDDPRILPLVNLGVGGVVLAHAVTASEVERMVHIARFPPVGDRGAHKAVRSADYGNRAYEEYIASIDRSVVLGVAIEDPTGIENAGEILAVPGLDLAFVGLQDLAQSLGRPGDFRHPSVREAIAHVVAEARATGTYIAVSQYTYEIPELRDLGVRMVGTSMDYTCLLAGFRTDVERARSESFA